MKSDLGDSLSKIIVFMLVFYLLALIFVLPSKADPTLTVRFCSSGFRLAVMPTNGGLVYISTGYYELEPQSFGQCIGIYDPTTQYDRFYLVNSSGAYYLGGYYEYGFQNESLFKSLNLTGERRAVNLTQGDIDGDRVIFHFKNRTYQVQINNITPYLWDKRMLGNLIAFPRGNGIVIIPAVEVNVIEDNFTLSMIPGKKIGTIQVRFNFTYKIHWNYPYLLSDSYNGVIEWTNTSNSHNEITWEKLRKTFRKPLYVFYYNGSSVNPYPLLKITLNMTLKGFELSPEYRFNNLAGLYISSQNNTVSSPPVSNKFNDSYTLSSTTSRRMPTDKSTTFLKGLALVTFSVMALVALHLYRGR
ncbi:hypothetical protein [Thermococcus stetteri]|uniref:hypothetical protein n=1 Tax=Thermococcus stetteri TaxID=49900 RepID=UPI001AE67DF5|nr:hypothetical protein [Thermococcus stetteri]MBP1913067.1 hypothetical protein [Thermococcus stetteri]